MADQRKTFAVAGRIDRPKAPKEAAVGHAGGPWIEVLLADPVSGSATAWRIPQGQPQTQGVRRLFPIYGEHSARKTGDRGKGDMPIVVESDEPPEGARPASDNPRLNSADDFGADRRPYPGTKEREVDTSGAFEPAWRGALFDQEVRDQRRMSWVYPSGLTSLNPASSAALREAIFDLRMCA